jgi:hypothetical protein
MLFYYVKVFQYIIVAPHSCLESFTLHPCTAFILVMAKITGFSMPTK